MPSGATIYVSTDSGVFVAEEVRRSAKNLFITNSFPFFGVGSVPGKIPLGDTFYRVHYSLETAVNDTSRKMSRLANEKEAAAAALRMQAQRIKDRLTAFHSIPVDQRDEFAFSRQAYLEEHNELA